jgi:thioredoxin 1
MFYGGNRAVEKIIFGGLLGATVGFVIGWAGARSGGSCAFLCNPYIAAVLLGVMGAALASGLGPREPAYTPSKHLITVESKDEFDSVVLQAEGPVLVDFTIPGCYFCKKLEPVVHSLADRYAGRITVVKMGVENVPSLMEQHALKAYPTLILFEGGLEVDRVRGYRDEATLTEWLDPHAP